jgi:hypothetical protein
LAGNRGVAQLFPTELSRDELSSRVGSRGKIKAKSDRQDRCEIISGKKRKPEDDACSDHGCGVGHAAASDSIDECYLLFRAAALVSELSLFIDFGDAPPIRI